MPRRTLHPPSDNATYRDVLMFEERLKSTAASLQRRKFKYQLVLAQLLLIIAILLWETLLPADASLLAVPGRLLLARADIRLHPYIASGLLFVSVTTLLLFFASGMYAEKIAYANKYVPHANRSLRSFNMVLNVRKPPLRSKFAWDPLNFFFPRPRPPPPPSASRSSSPSGSLSPRSRSPSVSRPMGPLPPASNPRGELVFSSRVDKAFRDGYDRYRAAFERKRDEKTREEARKTWWGRILYRREMSPGPLAAQSSVRSVSSSSTASGSVRGRGGAAGTQSRSATPPTLPASNALMMRARERSRSPSMQSEAGTPPGTPRQNRERRRREGQGEASMRTLALENSFEYSQSQ